MAARHGQDRERVECTTERRVRLRVHIVVFARFLEGRDLQSADEERQRVRHVEDVDTQVCGRLAVDDHAHLGIAHDQRRVDVDRAGDVPEALEDIVRVPL